VSRYPWLFSAPIDLGVFLGSALVSVALLGIGAAFGILHSDSPEWIWVPFVLLIDVAHVWSTLFRVYFDRDERVRRRLLYFGGPALVYIAGVLVYSLGPHVFWRAAAYFAVYHFVRQQYGWVVLYRRKGHETLPIDRWIDTAAIYAASLYPLLYWHAHLPQKYWWFMPGDFSDVLPLWVSAVGFPIYLLILAAYLLRALQRWFMLGLHNPGKDIVVVTTVLCWYLGIVAFNSDYAFTVTNVVIHGVPYLALVYWEGRRRERAGHPGLIRLLAYGPIVFLAVLVVFAYGEELLWDRLVWQERPWLFGAGWSWGRGLEAFVVPLLALPQLTHYFLDGFIWRRQANLTYRQTSPNAQGPLP
jgi:hypothetical protein